MKAQNLTISLPQSDIRCNKNCPYCVSKMTVPVVQNVNLFERNLRKVLTMANSANVNSILITGKGEPTLNSYQLFKVLSFFDHFPIELQTNGIKINEEKSMVNKLFQYGLNTIAFSIDDLKTLDDYKDLFKHCKSFGPLKDKELNIRVCFNLHKNLINSLPKRRIFVEIFNKIKNLGTIDQMMFRNITIPKVIVDSEKSIKAAKWIKENTNYDDHHEIWSQFVCTKMSLVRSLPFGMKVYDLDGIGVTFSDYCIQDSNKEDDIRSLIYMEDGHLYTSWNSKGSKLF